MYIGARSDVVQSSWFWSNEKPVGENKEFSTADVSVCQQMAWPLTYDDEINLHGKDFNSEAYFMCEFKCE